MRKSLEQQHRAKKKKQNPHPRLYLRQTWGWVCSGRGCRHDTTPSCRLRPPGSRRSVPERRTGVSAYSWALKRRRKRQIKLFFSLSVCASRFKVSLFCNWICLFCCLSREEFIVVSMGSYGPDIGLYGLYINKSRQKREKERNISKRRPVSAHLLSRLWPCWCCASYSYHIIRKETIFLP